MHILKVLLCMLSFLICIYPNSYTTLSPESQTRINKCSTKLLIDFDSLVIAMYYFVVQYTLESHLKQK